MINETEQADGKRMDNYESLQVNRYCSRINSKLHMLLTLKPFQVPARNVFCEREHLARIPVRLVCVLDVSHSMAESHGTQSQLSKLDEIKIFGNMLAECSRPDDHVGIVVFGTSAEVIFPLQKMTDEVKRNLKSAFNEISLKGVTNISSGIFLAIEQFNLAFGKKTRCSNDNILLFSDGMPNEGLTNSHELTKEIIKRVKKVAEDCRFEPDYSIKFTTIGTCGFYPETLYHIGRLFGSGAFHHLGEDSYLSSDLMLPVLNLQETVLTGIRLTLTALNGVQFETNDSDPEFLPKSKDVTIASSSDGQFSPSACEEYLLIKRVSSTRSHRTHSISAGTNKSKMVASRSIPMNVESAGNQTDNHILSTNLDVHDQSEHRQHYLIHDIGIDMEKQVLISLQLPKKHKKLLKGKDVLSVKISYKDSKMVDKEFSTVLSYTDLPPKDSLGSEVDIVATYKTLVRIKACNVLDKAAALVAKLDRNAAIHTLDCTIDSIRNESEKLLADACNEEETYADLYKTIDPVVANLNRCRTYVGDYSVRWDDVWGRLKSLRSSMARETVTSPSVYTDKIQMFMTEELEIKLKEVSILFDKLIGELNLSKMKRDASSRSINRRSVQLEQIDCTSARNLEGESCVGLVTQV